MSKNSCCTCFSIIGDFDENSIIKILGLTPFKKHNKSDLRVDGKEYGFSILKYAKYSEYDNIVANQMEKTISELYPLFDKLLYIKEKFNVKFYLEVKVEMYVGEQTPALAPSNKVIEFLYLTGTEIDIDTYLYN